MPYSYCSKIHATWVDLYVALGLTGSLPATTYSSCVAFGVQPGPKGLIGCLVLPEPGSQRATWV